MLERRWKRFLGFIVLGCLMGGGCSEGPGPDHTLFPDGPPNVLFIAIDDLNDWVGYLHTHPDVKTPNLDRLAARSVVFTHAYTVGPVCNPSRAALLSGLRPSTTGIYTNHHRWPSSASIQAAVLLPEFFRRSGYFTLWAGKIFHGEGTHPYRKRLEAMWDDMTHHDGGSGPYSKKDKVKIGLPRYDYEAWEAPDTDFSDVRNATYVAEFLQQPHDVPFFIALGFYRPHLPWTAPRRYFERYDPQAVELPEVKPDDLSDVPPIGKRFAGRGISHEKVVRAGEWGRLVRAYLASITFMDDQLGRVLDALEDSPYADNTVIVVWSDHGFHLGGKHHWTKLTLWEEATRVPLLFYVPGMEPARVNAPVSLLDVYPTLVDLTGLPEPPTRLEGYSLVPLFRNPQTARNVGVVTSRGRNTHAVRLGPWRYIRYWDGTEELYNHSTDPNEWTNLALGKEYEPVKEWLRRWLPDKSVPPVSGRQKQAPQN